MSLAWMPAVPLVREPWRAVLKRIVGRAVMPGIGLWLAGVPGTPWVGATPWAWLRITIFIFTLPAIALFLLAFANVAKNRRVLLKMMPTGSIERPRSIQEKWMKIPQEYAIGKTVLVSVEPWRFVSRADPRVTLRADGTVSKIPLYGMKAEDFVAEANEKMKGRGVTLELVSPPAA